MLLEASFANHLSFADKQTFSMVADSASEHEEHNVAKVQAYREHRILKSALVYGANASGKSNFLLSVMVMRRLVLNSAGEQHGSKLDIKPFRLDSTLRNEPSEFEVQFIADGVRYQYGFSADKNQIFDEWLFAFPKGQAQMWFQRAWDADQKEHGWQFGNNFFGQKAVWQRATRKNSLFLSTAIQLNSKQLEPIFDWFRKTVNFISMGVVSPEFTARALQQEDRKEAVLKFLQDADLNFFDIKIVRTPIEETLPEDLPSNIRKLFLENTPDKELLKVQTQRLDDLDLPVAFNFEDEESDGTRKFFGLIGPWLDVLENGLVVFVDELNNSLHTHLVELLIKLFHNPGTNPNNAQLIFTTHDTNQLSQKIFRRDQIWFAEKDCKQATQLFPLTDFKVTKGRENLEAAYLSGRYGAVPFIAEDI